MIIHDITRLIVLLITQIIRLFYRTVCKRAFFKDFKIPVILEAEGDT